MSTTTTDLRVTYRDADGEHVGQVWADAPGGALWVLPALGGGPVSVRDWEPASEPQEPLPEPAHAPVDPPADVDPRVALVGQWATNARWLGRHLVAGLGVNPRSVYTSCGTFFFADETQAGGDETLCRGCVLADPQTTNSATSPE